MTENQNKTHPSDEILRKVNLEIARRKSVEPPEPRHDELGYVVGEQLFFGQDPNEAIARRMNFSYPEPHHTWTLGKHASFELRLAKPLVQPHLIHIDLVPFLFPGREAQRVDMAVNGAMCAKWIVTRSDRFHGLLTSNYEAPALRFRFDLYTPDAASPYESGISADQRVLGIAIRSLRVSAFSEFL